MSLHDTLDQLRDVARERNIRPDEPRVTALGANRGNRLFAAVDLDIRNDHASALCRKGERGSATRCPSYRRSREQRVLSTWT